MIFLLFPNFLEIFEERKKGAFGTIDYLTNLSYSGGAKMARIMKTTPKETTVEQISNLYICSVSSEGVKDKTITTYKQHFYAISKAL